MKKNKKTLQELRNRVYSQFTRPITMFCFSNTYSRAYKISAIRIYVIVVLTFKLICYFAKVKILF